jgi:two-component system OmpR family sensor kinase
MMISLRDRLVLVFFGITVVAFTALYLYVAPGLRTRLLDTRLHELATAARTYSPPVAETVGSSASGAVVRARVDAASRRAQTRVTLLAVSTATQPSGPQLTPVADSANPSTATHLGYPVAGKAVRTGQLTFGTEHRGSEIVAEAAAPVRFAGRVARVIVFSSPAADVLRTVSVVRQQILIAGAIALLLSLIGGYLLARWLTQRVKRLERAAERVAAGEFERPIAVDARDELGQLAVAFNDMQRQLGLLDKARKQFIATASHELRTPVFSLGGFVELLEDEDLDPATRRRFLGHVSEQVERLRKLSVDLLDLSRLESGSLELRPEPVDLGELTRSVSAEFEVSLAQHDAHLELRLSPSIEAVCDPVRIAQIVRILIDNALTHTPAGTRIVVMAGRENGTLRLAVRDDGGGIDAAAVPRIFEPFFTADDAQGSGLGLAIASELAERMDGRLNVNSRPGETVFTLEIPA